MPHGKDIMSPHHKEFSGLRISSFDDVEYLAPRLKYEDKREVDANTGSTTHQALTKGYFQSEVCFTLVGNGEPIGMFGVSSEGAIWLLVTDGIKKHKIKFIKESRKVIEFLLKKYRKLWNYVDARNELHIKWLKSCGFTFIRKVPHGKYNLPFYEFIKICVNQ
jgi:hypothetical protein